MNGSLTSIRQVATADQAVAQAAAVPGATYRPPQPDRRTDPTDATVVLPPEMSSRMESLERGMDAIAREVERIGEGQGFMTQALAERADGRAIGAGGAEPVPVRQREQQKSAARGLTSGSMRYPAFAGNGLGEPPWYRWFLSETRRLS